MKSRNLFLYLQFLWAPDVWTERRSKVTQTFEGTSNLCFSWCGAIRGEDCFTSITYWMSILVSIPHRNEFISNATTSGSQVDSKTWNTNTTRKLSKPLQAAV